MVVADVPHLGRNVGAVMEYMIMLDWNAPKLDVLLFFLVPLIEADIASGGDDTIPAVSSP